MSARTNPKGRAGTFLLLPLAASLGLTDLYNVEGGHNAWAAAGYPMDTGED